MKPEPIFEAVEATKTELAQANATDNIPVICLLPGQLLTQQVAKQLTQYEKMIFICGNMKCRRTSS